jgi:hypothetical protein
LISASANAFADETRNALDVVKSSIWEIIGVSDDSPVPRTNTGPWSRCMSFARSDDVSTSAPPPSVTRQHSSRCIGYATIRDDSTSSTVMGSRIFARGFCDAH